MKHFLLSNGTLLVLSAAVLGYPSAARADIVYVTVIGTVSSGTDGSGDFGTPSTNLAGATYTAQYKFDTSLGITYSASQVNFAKGGPFYGADSPSLGASLTINEQTFSIGGLYLAEIGTVYYTNYYSQSDAIAQDLGGVYLTTFMAGYPGDSPGLLNPPYSINSADNGFHYGQFNDGSQTNLLLSLSTYSVSLTDPTAVPEPASLALFGAGLASLGLIRRRRA